MSDNHKNFGILFLLFVAAIAMALYLSMPTLSLVVWVWMETLILALVGVFASVALGQWKTLTEKMRATVLFLLGSGVVLAALGNLVFFTGDTMPSISPNLATWALGAALLLIVGVRSMYNALPFLEGRLKTVSNTLLVASVLVTSTTFVRWLIS